MNRGSNFLTYEYLDIAMIKIMSKYMFDLHNLYKNVLNLIGRQELT